MRSDWPAADVEDGVAGVVECACCAPEVMQAQQDLGGMVAMTARRHDHDHRWPGRTAAGSVRRADRAPLDVSDGGHLRGNRFSQAGFQPAGVTGMREL